jgi:hypothetical protein
VLQLVAGVEQLSLRDPLIRIAWGEPGGGSLFAASSPAQRSLDVVVCLCAAPFWNVRDDGSADGASPDEVRRVFGALLGCETYSQTRAAKISETKGPPTVDELMVGALRSVFAKPPFSCTVYGNQRNLVDLGCGTGPTSPLSKPDFTVSAGEMVVFIAEFKNNVTAPIEQLPQAAAEGCNAVLAQLSAGVPTGECRCELLLTNGHLFQFAVVTLLPPCMPRVVVRRACWTTVVCSI